MLNIINQDDLEIETIDYDKVLEDGISLNIPNIDKNVEKIISEKNNKDKKEINEIQKGE